MIMRHRLSITFAALFALVPLGLSQSALDQKLREVRFDLRIQDGKITGGGAPVIEKAISGAKYVLIGEDHITHEIPQFAAAVCNIMAPQGEFQFPDFLQFLVSEPESVAREIIPELKRLGAEGIVEYPLNKVVY